MAALRKTEPAKLAKLIRGDLDWIVMKALEKDRTRRYETANGFARDIQKHLDGDPVEACPPSAGYRLSKFARKHRAALFTAGAFAALLMFATLLSVSLAVWASRAERATRIAAREAKAERDKAVLAEKDARSQRDRAVTAESKERVARETAVARLGQIEKANDLLSAIFSSTVSWNNLL